MVICLAQIGHCIVHFDCMRIEEDLYAIYLYGFTALFSYKAYM